MKVQNKTRFVSFIVVLMIVSGVVGYFIGSSAYANTCETVSEKPPEEVESVEEVATIEFEDLGVYTLTAYCGCEKCCGKRNRPVDENGKTIVKGAGGVELVEGVHCASPLPLGTVIEIDGFGAYEVQDRTASWVAEKYNEKIIDIYFESHEDALKFEKHTARVKKVIEVA